MKKEDFDFEAVFEADDYLYFYENALPEYRTIKEINFIEKELNLSKNMKILDLACGHGRHSNNLAEKGYDILGIDNNLEFIKLAEKIRDEKNLNAKYINEFKTSCGVDTP